MNDRELFDLLSLALFGRKASECVQKEICVSCGKPAENFKTVRSSMAYLAFALCQCCQDETKAFVDKARGGDDISHAE